MKQLLGIITRWLPLAVGIIGVTGLIYVAVQQNYRLNLNDPQIQLAQDMAEALRMGKQPNEVVPRYIFNADTSMDVFLAVYDSSGTPLEASATIDNLPPKPPLGVFEHAKTSGENRVAWQPANGTRIALVVRPVKDDRGYFVAAGRNMKEIEQRIDNLGKLLALGLAAVLVLTFLFEVIGDAIRRRTMKVPSNK